MSLYDLQRQWDSDADRARRAMAADIAASERSKPLGLLIVFAGLLAIFASMLP